ncbi:4Fe-4S dicluster domain-containing protein [Mycoplasmatota bacterium WC44]
MDYIFENNTQEVKFKVLKEAARAGFNKDDDISLRSIAKAIIPGPKPTFRCCIHKERTIIREQLKYSFGKVKSPQVVNVIESACEQCPIDRYTVTNACQGCIARSCVKSCKSDAIIMVDNHAYINQEKCIECGKCKKACQFDAISDIKRPCKRSCPVDAIEMDENKIAGINYSKCISCGHCVYSCPFGAITDTSEIYDVARLLSSNEDIYALVAPSISSQFCDMTISQVKKALKAIGFKDVIEVALGSDIVIKTETEEFIEQTNSFMTTSCCPAFVNLVKTKFPKVNDNVSTTVSPMVALGKLVKSYHSDAKTVFIGPCIAKKHEAEVQENTDAIDYVLTFEELRSLLGAKDVSIKEQESDPLNNASYYGRIFAISGGVSGAISDYIKTNDIDATFKPFAANGAKECIKQLTLASLNKQSFNFLEGMICEGGCISGPGSITHTRKDANLVKEYASLAKEKTVADSLQIHEISNLALHKNNHY